MNHRQDPSTNTPTPTAVPDVSGARSVMFVCLGNICRSPMAQGVFEHLAIERGVRQQLTIASAGTGHWHIGDDPDHRTIAICRDHGVGLSSKGRQLCRDDFSRFDLLLAMDRQNLRDILAMGCPSDRAALFLSFAPPAVASACGLVVPDPYTGTMDDFRHVYTLVQSGAQGLLDAMFR